MLCPVLPYLTSYRLDPDSRVVPTNVPAYLRSTKQQQIALSAKELGLAIGPCAHGRWSHPSMPSLSVPESQARSRSSLSDIISRRAFSFALAASPQGRPCSSWRRASIAPGLETPRSYRSSHRLGVPVSHPSTPVCPPCPVVSLCSEQSVIESNRLARFCLLFVDASTLHIPYQGYPTHPSRQSCASSVRQCLGQTDDSICSSRTLILGNQPLSTKGTLASSWQHLRPLVCSLDLLIELMPHPVKVSPATSPLGSESGTNQPTETLAR